MKEAEKGCRISVRCGVEFLFHIPCVTDQSISSDRCSLRPRECREGREGEREWEQ